MKRKKLFGQPNTFTLLSELFHAPILLLFQRYDNRNSTTKLAEYLQNTAVVDFFNFVHNDLYI